MILLNYENVHFSLGYVNNAKHIDLNFDIPEEYIANRNSLNISDNIEKIKKFEISEFFYKNKLLMKLAMMIYIIIYIIIEKIIVYMENIPLNLLIFIKQKIINHLNKF